MGNRESVLPLESHLSYDEAQTFLSTEEFMRIEAAWNGRESLTEEEFFNEVLCHHSIPPFICSHIHTKFCENNKNRLTFQSFIVGIVILTKVKKEIRSEFLRNEPCVEDWITNPPELTSHLSEIHYNFYQVLAGVTHLDEREIEELEKVFGSITDTKLCKLTRNGFKSLISGAIEDEYIDRLFHAFDENGDNLIDFKELVCGLSASCRGPHMAQLSFIARMFDLDGDGFLASNDLSLVYDLLSVSEEARTIHTDFNGYALLADFVCWANENSTLENLLEKIVQIGHICLGLRPRKEWFELKIVNDFKNRASFDSYKEWNIISSQWFNEWHNSAKLGKPVSPLNNSSILASKSKNDWIVKVPSLSGGGAPLLPGLREGRDFEKLPPCLWRALLRWHGSATREGISLLRRVVPSAYLDPSSPEHNELILELYPLSLLILRHGSSSGGWLQSAFDRNKDVTLRQLPWCLVSFSRSSTVPELLEILAAQLKISDNDSIRLWIMEIDGKRTRKLLHCGSDTLHDLNITSSAQVLLEVRNADMSWPEEVSRLDSNNADMDANENDDSKSVKGVVGLYNMGNTCFINSALQCLSNTMPLTEYFLSGKHKEAIEGDTCNGKVSLTLEFGDFIEEIWSGKRRNTAPIKIQRAISHSSKLFAERGQHDCQEFITILLNLLHEELNVVTVKPYNQLSDSNGRPESALADEAWESHLAREKSIISDIFSGQLHSSLACRNCGNVSCTFESFMFLQLPIPIDNLLLIPVVVVKRDGCVPTRYGYRMNNDSTIYDLKLEIVTSSLLPVDSLQVLCLNRSGQLIKNVSEAIEGDENLLSSYPGDSLLYAFSLRQQEDDENRVTIPKVHTIIAAHRKMQYNESYFLGASRGCTIQLFGIPIVLPFIFNETTGNELYEEVWLQVSRLLIGGSTSSENTIKARGVNRAIDAGEDIRSGYPFDLRMVGDTFEWCQRCPWSSFCRGCVLFQSGTPVARHITALAIDWKPTALYLRYQHSVELLCRDDESVLNAWQLQYQPCSLISCLNDFTNSELLDEEVTCGKCEYKTPRTKTLAIWRLPKILIIHLKRFVNLKSKRTWIKSYKVVEYPLRGLDLCEWVSNPNRPNSVYNCFAIANHYGAMGSGHYVTYAKNKDQWFCFNDSSCQAVKESQINKKSAYLLFYERVD